MGYYRVISGVRFDERILRAAEAVAAQPCHNRAAAIDDVRVLPIVAAATDGRSVTLVEQRSIKRVLDSYTFTSDAKAALLALLPAANGEDEEQDDGCLYRQREPDPPFYGCSAS